MPRPGFPYAQVKAPTGASAGCTSLECVANPSREVPPPLEGNDFVITATVTGAWAVALVVALLLRSQIPAPDRWSIWTCAAGFGMGLFGLAYVPHLKRSRARAAARRAERAVSGSSGSTASGEEVTHQ